MLSPDQLSARKGKLTASRVACLMTGDAAKILDLWREMTGDPEYVPEDLSRVWPVQLGSATEELNLRWFEAKNGPIRDIGLVATHYSKYPWAACTLDGWSMQHGCPIECKHVGGREPLEVVIDRYQPQMQWQMFVTGATQCALSVIMGSSEPIVEFIPRDEQYIGEMVRRGEQFMAHVRNKTPPVALPAVLPPVDASKVYDMTGNNTWGNFAGVWLSTRTAAEECKIAEKTLKAQVPEDSKKSHGHGVQITRDRAGRLSLREAK